MASSVFGAFRREEEKFRLALILLVVLVLVVVLVVYFYRQTLGGSFIENLNYTQLQRAYNITLMQLRNTTAAYSTVEYNLTHPYIKNLYTSYNINIPMKNISSTVTNVTYSGPNEKVNSTYTTTYYTYAFSFNATYPGYLMLNATSSAVNSKTNNTWEFIVSNQNVIPNATMVYYNYQTGSGPNPFQITTTGRGVYRVNFDQNSPRTIYAPTPTQLGTVGIPVNSGTVYVWVANLNNQSISVTFSAKYVGMHTH